MPSARPLQPTPVRTAPVLPLQNQLHDVARFKPMTATATRMVKAVWQAYFRPGAKAAAEAAAAAAEGGAAKVVEEDENEEEAEDDVAEDALAGRGGKKAGKKASKAAAKKKPTAAALAAAKGAWVGAISKTVDGCKFYSKAKVGEGEGWVRSACANVLFLPGFAALYTLTVPPTVPPSVLLPGRRLRGVPGRRCGAGCG